jgi:hypothetical protein
MNLSRSSYSNWLPAIRSFAASEHRTYSQPYGYWKYVMPETEFNALHPPTLNEDGTFTPITRVPPDAPVLAANANTATSVKYQSDLQEFVSFTNAENAVKAKILETAGENFRMATSDEYDSHMLTSAKSLLAYAHDHYGTADQATFDAYAKSLEAPLADMATFRAHANGMTKIFRLLAAAGQAKSNTDQIALLIRNTAAHPAIAAAIVDYNKANPDFLSRTFTALVQYIAIHAPILSTAGNMAYVGHAQASDMAAMKKQLSELATSMSALIRENETLKRNNNASAPPRQAQKQHSTPRTSAPLGYCFHHGFGHKGTKCRHMAENPEFTPAMIAANAPTTINGIEGSTHNPHN